MKELAFLVAVIGIALQLWLVLCVHKLAQATDTIAANYNAVSDRMTKAMEKQAESIRALSENLKPKQ